MNRNAQLDRLRTETFDLCIIGGGASGAGSALDAALRGLRVALIEKTDFAAETSSKSTKLIHGGVRYLEQAFKNADFAQLRQVRHGLEERSVLLRNAPHLARPLALITPVRHFWEGLYYRIGLKIYDFFASRRDVLPGSRWISKKEMLRRMPALNKRLHSAVLYYDGQLDDARYCLALVCSAAETGAAVCNHTCLEAFETDAAGRIQAVIARDTLHNQPLRIQTRAVLNCTGPHSDAVRRLANPRLPDRLKVSRGVHLSLPAPVLNTSDALLIPKTPDGRVAFAIPFENYCILGTTDTPENQPDAEPILDRSERDFLLETLQPYLENPIPASALSAGFGGLRPLVQALPGDEADISRNTKTMLRDHVVEEDPGSGLISLLGGKWTTYRLMAQDAVDAVCRQLGIKAPSRTRHHLLWGAREYHPDYWKTIQQQWQCPAPLAVHLTEKYGTNAPKVLALAGENPEWLQPLHPAWPYVGAEVVYAYREEMACTLRDILARRFRMEILNWQDTLEILPRVAAILAQEAGWTQQECAQAELAYRQQLRHFIQAAGG
jgi:glycerol-3-phosphate dehydrogenase